MDSLMLLATPLLPLLLMPLALRGANRSWLTVAATLPALLTALLLPVGSGLQLPWLLLGSELVLDATARLLLLFSAVVWLVAGLQLAMTRRITTMGKAFGAWFLAAMAGNFLLLLAADALTFYVGFALMGLSVYGLLVPQRSQRARRSGQVYLAFTLVGELALFAGIVMLAAASESLLFVDLAQQSLPPAAVTLFLIGFGIKVALPGLHLWLPMTYTVAPAIAVAVLSGPMMKTGLVGWVRFLPPGGPGLELWGTPLMLLGGVGVVLGVLLGVLQRTPRAVLAYSSVAKMGLMSALFGLALKYPQQADAIVAALLVFAVHHLLVKASLFLGVGLHERLGPNPWLLVGMGLLALSLAAAPFTAGSAAKQVLGHALDGELVLLMTLSAIGTAWLMIRLMVTLRRDSSHTTTPLDVASLPFFGIAALAALAPFAPAELLFESSSVYPLVFAALSALAARHWMARWVRQMPRVSATTSRLIRVLATPWSRMLNHRLWQATPNFCLSSLAVTSSASAAADWIGGGVRWLSVLAAMLLLGVIFN